MVLAAGETLTASSVRRPGRQTGCTLRARDLVHLLRGYQAVIAGRPLEAGNREFLRCLIASSRQLGDALARSPRCRAPTPSQVRCIRALLAQQEPESAKQLAHQVIHLLNGLGEDGAADLPSLYLAGTLPVLSPGYRAIHVLFGSGLGLGDQIACYRLLKSVTDRYPEATTKVYTPYPKVWLELLPGVKEVSYRTQPLRPFKDLASRSGNGRDLVLVIDFDCFEFHRRVIPRRPGRDIVELSLARLTAWASRHGSPWIHFETFAEPSFRNYYYLLDAVGRRLLALPRDVPWSPRPLAPRAPPKSGRMVLLLNPFTSKPSSMVPSDWADYARTIMAFAPGSFEFDVFVYPGLDSGTHQFAGEICRLLGDGSATVRARLIDDGQGRPLSPFVALSRLANIIAVADFCLTADTFTGHLAPLYMVPTVVITDRDRPEFWVPGPWSYYCLVERTEHALGHLAKYLLMARDPRALSGSLLRAAAAMDQAVVRAQRGGLTRASISELIAVLRGLLDVPRDEVPYRKQAAEWLLIWSRLAAAVARHPAPPRSLSAYLYRWTESEFVKVIRLYARSAMRTPS